MTGLKNILLYFSAAGMETHQMGPYTFYDKIPLKSNLEAQGVRLVPQLIRGIP